MMEIEQGQKLEEAKSQKYYFFLRRNSQEFLSDPDERLRAAELFIAALMESLDERKVD